MNMNMPSSRLSRFLITRGSVALIELIFALNHIPIPIGSIAILFVVLLLYKNGVAALQGMNSSSRYALNKMPSFWGNAVGYVE